MVKATDDIQRVKLFIWPIRSETADLLFSIANGALITGAAVVFLATWAAINLSFVRETFSNLRISANEALTATGVADAAKANEGLVVAQATIKTNEKQIADANERAAEATREAARLGVKVDDLPAFVTRKELELTALVDRMSQGSAELDAARIGAEAAHAKAERALETFRKEAGGRTLTKDQRDKLAEGLRGKISSKVWVQSDPGDVEAYPYAMQILGALKSDHIDSEWQPWPTLFTWMNDPGLFVIIDGESMKEQGKSLLDALNAAGLEAQEATRSQEQSARAPASGRLTILVWHRRPPTPSEK